MARKPRAEHRPIDARADATVFKIAHLSDLHLAAEPSRPGWHQSIGFWGHVGVGLRVAASLDIESSMTSHDPKCFRALMDALTGQNRYTSAGYDGYIVTGDLATTGSSADMAAAAGMLRREHGVAGGETFDAPKLPNEKVVLLPGNHDRYYGRKLGPTSTEFEQQHNFGFNWSLGNPLAGDSRPDVNHKVLRAMSGAQLAVVCGDFSFLTPSVQWIKMLGRGRARQETLERMVAQTTQYQEKSIPVVWAVHFPPVKRGVQSALRLERHEEVIRAAARCGVQIVFCGHTHVASPSLAGVFDDKFPAVQIVCAASACEHVKAKSKTQRSYFEVELEVRGKTVRLRRPPVEMIYSRWLERTAETSHRAAIFCPAP